MSVKDNLHREKYWLNKKTPRPRGGTPMEVVITAAAKYRMLQPWEEVELGHLVWENSRRDVTPRRTNVELFGDGLIARQRLVECNQRLVIAFSKKFLHRGLEQFDLCAEGMIGLQRAAEMFDPTKGHKFSTYASWWIKQAIRRALFDQGRTIRVPCHVAEKMEKICQASNEYAQKHGRSLRPDEVAIALGMSESNVRAVIQYYSPLVSLDKQVGEDVELSHYIAATLPSESVEEKLLREQLWRQLIAIMPAEMAQLVWLSKVEDLSGKEIEHHLGLPANKVRNGLSQALNRLRNNRDRFASFLDLEVG